MIHHGKIRVSRLLRWFGVGLWTGKDWLVVWKGMGKWYEGEDLEISLMVGMVV